MAVREAPLLEREAELDELVAALEHARAGRGRLVVVEGVAGIGKTRLLQAARDTAERLGMRVLRSRGTELERDFPFALVRQLFEPALHAMRADERAELFDEAAEPAAPVVGIDAGDPADEADSTGDPSFPTLNGLYWLTSNLAEACPLVLAVDDAHWADAPSLRFFRFLLPRLEEMPVLLAVAARPSDPGSMSELLAELVADPVARVLRPKRLSPEAVSELVRESLSAQAHDEFCSACHEASAGNPFMVRELLVELGEEGSSGTAADAARVSHVAPATIQRAVVLRVGRLPEPAAGLARAVAVLGDDVEPRLAGALARLESNVVGGAAEALASAGILEPGRPLRFVHPLVRNAVYADLPGADRAAAHHEAAALLEGEGAEPERVAVHLLATDPARDAAVVETLSAAAQRALDRAAPEAAIAYARRALADLPDQTARRDLLWHLVRGSFRAGDRAAVEDLESDVFEELTADPQTLLATSYELSLWVHGYAGLDECVSLMERAEQAALEAGDYDLVMRFEALIAAAGRTRATDIRRRWERYRDRIAAGTPAEGVWLTLQAWWRTQMGEPAATVAPLARRALEGSLLGGDQPITTFHGLPIYVLIRADELDAAEQAIQKVFATGRGGRSTPAIAGAFYFRADLALARGDVSRAEADARAMAETLYQADLVPAFPHWLGLLIEVLVERGELDAAEDEIQGARMAGDLPDEGWYHGLLLGRGYLRLAQGRTAEGLADLGEVARRARQYGTRNFALAPAGARAAIALSGLRDETSSRGLIETYRQTIRDWGTVSAIALTALGRGKPRAGWPSCTSAALAPGGRPG